MYRPVPPDEFISLLREDLAGEPAAVELLPAFGDFGEHLVVRASEDVAVTQAVHGAPTAAHLEVAHLAVEHRQRHRGVLEEQSQVGVFLVQGFQALQAGAVGGSHGVEVSVDQDVEKGRGAEDEEKALGDGDPHQHLPVVEEPVKDRVRPVDPGEAEYGVDGDDPYRFPSVLAQVREHRYTSCAAGAHSCARHPGRGGGKPRVTAVPLPGTLTIETVPPCRLMMERTMASPSPLPWL